MLSTMQSDVRRRYAAALRMIDCLTQFLSWRCLAELRLAAAPDGRLEQHGGRVAGGVNVYLLDGEDGDVSLVGFGAVGVVHDRLGVLDALLADQVRAGGGARGSGAGAGLLDQFVVVVEQVVGELENNCAIGVDIRRNLVQVDEGAVGDPQRLRPELNRPVAWWRISRLHIGVQRLGLAGTSTGRWFCRRGLPLQ